MTAQDPLPQAGNTPAAANEVDADEIPAELTPTTRPRVGDSFDPRKSFFPPGITPEHIAPLGPASGRSKRRGLPVALVAIAVLVLGAAAAWDLLKDFSKKAPSAQTRAEGTVSKAAPAVREEERAPATATPVTSPALPAAASGTPPMASSTVTHTHSTTGTAPPAAAPAVEAAPAPAARAARARPATPAPSRPATQPQATPPARNCDPALSALGLC